LSEASQAGVYVKLWTPRCTRQVPTHSPFIQALSAAITKSLYEAGS
jgi:hypothetical protein